ncbi:bifunctional DNA-formamidopyrimidine glycosylase/DNA-(apurinic or apyrimidinic site) lyase [Vibrio marisflavi]|uniref:Formamidopyrimidine-DNA glycosylase n=1 Tax=Vibrio marisflavi CECT 7928 TaxID=634439 RepID=A0ABM9A8M0_9VIBR|nr:bifunctional DNA-formamidopyrimidine glycosylase/DNA-(apurinic or apyrimidinic site) lyase [Vibrio marisflavi]CAH0541798.1 Formamidopyrimidine-DNA glycosylase [Vibrio marisflavi CECT 7928]
MPELPEVEVSRMGITPHLVGHVITKLTFRTSKLRWDIPNELKLLQGQTITGVYRRAKYLLIETDVGSAMVHLGMSGSLRVLDSTHPPAKHDHVDMQLDSGKVLRYNDPRRFGAWLWCEQGTEHELLVNIGPEPLTDAFNVQYMHDKANGKRVAIKQFIMDNKIVVGVGNIYANESLFTAGISPLRAAGKLSESEWEKLVSEIKQVLNTAIEQGGTTLKDFAQADGKPGYFAQELKIYGKAKQPCPNCGEKIQEQKIGQRNTFFCSSCQS